MSNRHHSNKRRKSKSAKSRSQSSEKSEDASPIFEIKTSPIMGRYMVSQRMLKPGDVILSEEPLVVGPCSGCKVQCLGCYKTIESALTPHVKCKSCMWPLCSHQCQGLHQPFGHTQIECGILKKARHNLNYNDFDQLQINYHAIVPLRCLILKTTNPQAYEQLMQMETHNEIRRKIPDLWRSNQETIVNRIIDDWGLTEFSAGEIHSICGILEVNSFEIGQQGVNIRGIYPTAFLMSHNCVPNTNHTDEEGTFQLTVRASTPITIDQPITISYAYTLQSTLKRREHLMENKFFECLCQRCSDPTELGAYTGALICPKCITGLVLSTKPLDHDAAWSCTNRTKCPGYTVTARSMDLLIDRISQEADGIDCNDIGAMELFLQKYRNVLHPTHYLCLNIKLSLSQLYGKINGFLIYELSDELLVRKQEVCEEIMKIFDIIEPGYTRLRGVTLYEMHAPLMILLTRRFETKCASKSELRCKLKKVVKCLEEASVILSFESENSPEGMMGVAAKDALGKIKEWEKILGKL